MPHRFRVTEPVDFLFDRAYPDYKMLLATGSQITLADMVGDDFPNRLEIQKKIKEAGEYKKKLESLPPEELQALYKVERDKYQQEINIKAEKEEQARIFNRPISQADFVYWSKAAYWTIDEAIALSFGKSPKLVNWELVEPNLYASPFAKKYADLRELVLRAVTWKQLFDPIMPSLYLAWTKRCEIEVPQALVDEVEKRAGLIGDWKELYDGLKQKYDSLRDAYESLAENPQNTDTQKASYSKLSESDYWKKLEQIAAKAIDEYPAWKDTQRKVQKTGNLQDWLIGLGADNREAEVLKKILSDFFRELK